MNAHVATSVHTGLHGSKWKKEKKSNKNDKYESKNKGLWNEKGMYCKNGGTRVEHEDKGQT